MPKGVEGTEGESEQDPIAETTGGKYNMDDFAAVFAGTSTETLSAISGEKSCAGAGNAAALVKRRLDKKVEEEGN